MSLAFCVFCLLCSCQKKEAEPETAELPEGQYLVVLGIAQDAGFPHINYPEEWEDVYKGNRKRQLATCLGLVDTKQKQKWIFEASPDMPQQLHNLEARHLKTENLTDGVFLTHAHIGHYTGLMHFGREAMGANRIPVYAMPKMKSFLQENGPWSQLVKLNNIEIRELADETPVELNQSLKVTPFLVPHRDEFSETVGYKIEGREKTALFIPDINKWRIWEKDILEEVKKVDYAFLDATFLENGEIPRDMNEVPHPFIEETAKLFEDQPAEVKSKVVFIHFNHSNGALNASNQKRKSLEKQGFRFAAEGDIFDL
ncbi:pyrroloquinoline quinone biosynthesis protein PqqB [Leptobacterium flavescens]|uniref:Pyrroloquinoline quinone biosynthesis protein PqqB n=2 Tax=Leptobacterium flavescens TaxID=472055 RepID=A0A6P0UTT6_9FLAO|nr:pyrroloquinoline quinone biosynthesis protein PqqB [Leptobacterium flavescens]